MKYSQEELEKAFEEVSEREDWKAPILKYVEDKTEEELKLIRAAVIHFTATSPEIQRVGPRRHRIEADGYRLGPAGP